MNNRNLSEWGMSLLVALVLVLMLSQFSPINCKYGGDLNIFLYMGASWANGNIPYTELFDHKGPLLFFIYMLGYLIAPGKLGISIIAIASITISNKLVLNISQCILKEKYNKDCYKIFGLYTILLFITSNIGTQTEILSLCLILLPLYLLVKFVESQKKIEEHSLLYSLIYGICFGANALIRINNASIIVGIVLGFVILLIKCRAYKSLLYNAISFIIGLVIITAPFVIYFYINDSLYDMFYATFIFNLKYRASWSAGVSLIQRLFYNLSRLLPCFILLILSIIHDKKHSVNYSYFTIPASLVCVFAFATGATYGSYFTNVLPYFILMLIFIFGLPIAFKMRKLFFVSIGFVLLPYLVLETIKGTCLRNLSYNISYLLNGDDKYEREYSEISQMLTIIPEKGKESVYLYGATKIFPNLIEQGIYPTSRFSFSHEVFSKVVDPAVGVEVDNFHNSTTSEWIVGGKLNSVEMTSFKELLTKYECVSECYDIQLYKLKK